MEGAEGRRDRDGGVKVDRAGQRGGPAGCVEAKAGLLLPASFLHCLYWDLRQWGAGGRGRRSGSDSSSSRQQPPLGLPF
jgi:hypothetical protein